LDQLDRIKDVPILGYSYSKWPEGASRSEDNNGNQNAGFFDSIDPFQTFAVGGFPKPTLVLINYGVGIERGTKMWLPQKAIWSAVI
jgi:hypothetical protein